jgi:hypothetical protein
MHDTRLDSPGHDLVATCNEQMQRSEQSKKQADSLTRYLREAEADLLNGQKSQSEGTGVQRLK